MSKLTINVNDMIDLVKSEPGLTRHDQQYLEALRAAWFKRQIKGGKHLGRCLRTIISGDAVQRILEKLVPPLVIQRLKAAEVAKIMIAMSSSP